MVKKLRVFVKNLLGTFFTDNIGWFAFNTSFIPENNILRLTAHDLDPDKHVEKNISKYPKDFFIDVRLELYNLI